MKEIFKRGRIAQWIILAGGTAICLTGGLVGFLGGDQITQIIGWMVAAAFGLEGHNKIQEP